MQLKRMIGAFAMSSAVMLIVGCGDKGVTTTPEKAPTGEVEVTSIQSELLELANNEYADLNFFGIGQGSSNSESVANQIARDQALENLARSVQAEVEANMKRLALNDPSYEALEAAVSRSLTSIKTSITNTRERKMRRTFNNETKQNTVYVLITSPRDQILEAAKQKLRASEELAQMQRTLNLDRAIEQILNLPSQDTEN
jgi:hypothetical protein